MPGLPAAASRGSGPAGDDSASGRLSSTGKAFRLSPRGDIVTTTVFRQTGEGFDVFVEVFQLPAQPPGRSPSGHGVSA
jgi:hypothetical protein